MYAQGVMPSVRKVMSDLGGGDRNRICRILRDLRLPPLQREQSPNATLPPSISDAFDKLLKAEYERGKADGLQVAEEYKQANALLVAQNAELRACMAEMQAANRAASPRQMRTIVEEVLCDFLGEVRPKPKQRRSTPPEPPKNPQIRSGKTFS